MKTQNTQPKGGAASEEPRVYRSAPPGLPAKEWHFPPEPAQAKAQPWTLEPQVLDSATRYAAELERVKAERRNALDALWQEQKRGDELLAALKDAQKFIRKLEKLEVVEVNSNSGLDWDVRFIIRAAIAKHEGK